MASDPSNLIDIKVVTADGQIKWASEDPELLWAMRGTEGGFAIATQFKFRAHHLPENGHIWGGPIMIPRDKVAEAAKGIVSMVEKDKQGQLSPKTAIFLYVLRKEQMQFIGVTEDVLVVHAYDGRGQAEGREAFRWALDIEDAIDQTRSDMTFADIARMQGTCIKYPSSTMTDTFARRRRRTPRQERHVLEPNGNDRRRRVPID